jgi:hypothetical protein
MPANPTESVKWHLIAKAGGAGDADLDIFANKQSAEVQTAAKTAANKWLSTQAALRP